MHAPRSIRLAALAISMACGLALAAPAAAQISQPNRPFSAPKITTAKPNAAATSKITVQPWSTVDFGKVSAGRAQTVEVILMSEERVDFGVPPPKFPNFPNLGSLSGAQPQAEAPEPFVRLLIQGGAANDYSVQGEPEWRAGGPARPYFVNYDLVATLQFRPSAEGVRKTGMTINFRDYGNSGRQLIGMGAPASSSGPVQMRRPGTRPGEMVSLVGNPTTLGVNILAPGLPKKVRMCPEPLSPNAAWETVFPILGQPNQPVWLQQAMQNGKITGANAADFTLSGEIVLKQGAPATRLITFSPRGSGLRTAEYSQLQFDGSTVTTVLEGYGK